MNNLEHFFEKSCILITLEPAEQINLGMMQSQCTSNWQVATFSIVFVHYVSCIKRKKEVVKKSLVNKSLNYCVYNVRIRVKIFKFNSICFQSKIIDLYCQQDASSAFTGTDALGRGLPAIRRVYICFLVSQAAQARAVYIV